MASLVYAGFWFRMAEGALPMRSLAFRSMLVGGDYMPDMAEHAWRSDITNEIEGAGYAAGGLPTAVDLRRTAGGVLMTFAPLVWRAATIRARYQVVYCSRGGDAAQDELVFCNDFGGDVSSTADDFSVAGSSILNGT